MAAKPKNVGDQSLPVIEPGLTSQGTRLLRQITGMLNSPMVKVKVGIDKYGGLF